MLPVYGWWYFPRNKFFWLQAPLFKGMLQFFWFWSTVYLNSRLHWVKRRRKYSKLWNVLPIRNRRSYEVISNVPCVKYKRMHGWVITCPIQCLVKLLIDSQNLNGYTVEFWEWISNFSPLFKTYTFNYPCRGLSETMLKIGKSPILWCNEIKAMAMHRPKCIDDFFEN